MTTLGAGYISLSDAITGTPSGPSGDRVLFWAEDWRPKEKNGIKPKQTVDGESYTSSKGKVARTINLRRILIVEEDTDGGVHTGDNNNTRALNERLAFMRSHSKLSGNAAYLIITPVVDATNVDLSDGKDYMKGYIAEFDYHPEGTTYSFDIKFVESTLL